MRILHMAIAALATVLGFAGTSAMTEWQAAPAKQGRARSTMPLLPLSEADQTSTRETGCTCTFQTRTSALAQMIGHEFTIRTRAGRQVCHITDAQFSSLSDASGAASCGGLRLSLRWTGRVRQFPEADSFSGPAALTVGQGRRSQAVNGTWGCAC